MKKTKIICTIGPASENADVMRRMIEAGMNVARLNFSHGDYNEHGARIQTVRKLSKELDTPVAVLLDTKGPEIRCGLFKEGKIEVKEGQSFTFYTDDKEGDINGCSVSFKELYKAVKVGDRILVNDGLVGMQITAIEGTNIVCRVENNGVISNRKSVNVPGVSVPIPFLSEKDVADIKFGMEQNVDYIAASFVRSADDVNAIRKLLKEGGKERIQIISKIENHEGINNFSSILAASDGIMVARGDLGVEIPQERVPIAQRQMIEEALNAGKFIITATQMLDSMTNNPRPTRAEVNDVSNAVWQGTTAVMLSGESAAGKYPAETVKTMAQIAVATEESLDYWDSFFKRPHFLNIEQSSAIGRAACDLAASLNVKGILVLTQSGLSARAIARYRPACPIYAQTPYEEVCSQLALYWGVSAYTGENKADIKENLTAAINAAVKKGYFAENDLIVIAAGFPVGIINKTNFIKVHRIGEGVL